MDHHENKEYQAVKYVRELNEFWDAYMFALINEIMVGVAINLGMDEKKAYKLAMEKPETLQKSKFLTTIFDKFKDIFKYTIEPFRIKKKLVPLGSRPLTPAEWEKITAHLSAYWKRHADKLAEDMTVKGFMLGRDTTKFRRDKVSYKDKSLFQVANDQYRGNMPDNIAAAYKKYDFANSEKKSLNRAFSRVAMYVTETDKKLQSSIRKTVTQGINDGKSPVMVASDLYWDIQKKAGNTAESFRKNWNRISQYEMASVYEAGILAPYEADAMESLKTPEKARYFIFSHGTCKWCAPRSGTLTRLVPEEIVVDPNNDSLKSMGINDPNTDIAIWSGKNNINFYSYKEPMWRIATPAHPHGQATMTPIDLDKEFYNKKTGRVEKKIKEIKVGGYTYKPESHVKNEAEKEYRKRTRLDNGNVRWNGNIYEAVPHLEYARKKAVQDKNMLLPIPVDMDSTDYDNIFGNLK